MQTSKPNRAYFLAIRSADHLVARRHLEAAATILERYLQKYPPRKTVLRRLGRIRLAQGRPDAAAGLFNRALGRPGPATVSPAA